jgi:hypothetical protein
MVCDMKWKIVVHDEDKYIEVITGGIADREGSLNMAKAIKHTMRAHRLIKALIDHRNVGSVIGDTTEVYQRAKAFRLIGVVLRIKIAEIIKPEHLEHFNFFETVCLNHGYQLSVFQDKDKALAWLLI